METPLEQVLTSYYKEAMIAYLQAHPEAYEEAIRLALANKQPFGRRLTKDHLFGLLHF
jgi:hypothetical protein